MFVRDERAPAADFGRASRFLGLSSSFGRFVGKIEAGCGKENGESRAEQVTGRMVIGGAASYYSHEHSTQALASIRMIALSTAPLLLSSQHSSERSFPVLLRRESVPTSAPYARVGTFESERLAQRPPLSVRSWVLRAHLLFFGRSSATCFALSQFEAATFSFDESSRRRPWFGEP